MTVTPNAGGDGNATLCACGCGEALQAYVTHTDRWGYDYTERNRSIYASKACKQRAYRKRVKAGTVKPRAVRDREAAAKRLPQVNRELVSARRRLADLRQEIKDLEELRDELDALANPAQVNLVTTLPAATVKAMQDAAEPAWVFELGTVTDDELASRNGLTVRTVRGRRRKYGIGRAKGGA